MDYLTEHFTNRELEIFLDKTSISKHLGYYKTIKIMFYNGSISNNKELMNLIEYLKSNTNIRGITCEQAVDLTNTYLNTPIKYYNDKNMYKLQHIVCGMIIDWWNINKYKNILGSIACYYDRRDNHGKINKNKNLLNPAFLNKEDYYHKFWINYSTF